MFVYGTLRRGYDNRHALALQTAARFLGQARIPGRLCRLPHYPALAPPASESDWVTGDLYEGVTPSLFQQLDEYEGAEYSRRVAEVTTGDGTAIAAYIYLSAASTEGLELVPSGDWNTVTSPAFPPE